MASKKRICLDDFEEEAKGCLDPMMWNYYRGGADEEVTLRDSHAAYLRYRLRPKVLRDVSKRDLSTTILGHRVSFPCGISPTAFHKGAHPDGEIATARAAAAAGVFMSLSCGANVTIEDIADSAPGGLRMMQTYIYKNPKITELLLRRAEKAGFKALLVTVDVAVYGYRRNEKEFDLYETVRTNPAYHQLKWVNMEMMKEEADQARAAGDPLLWDLADTIDDAPTWDDIRWLKKISSIPVIVKGILTGEMAREAVGAGVDGIMVSAHGGRQLDTSIAPLDALPEVVEAVRDTNIEVYVDGGVRTGTDIIKALALGARAAFIGRPAIYGIACGGEEGLTDLLDILKDEFSRAMALSGCARVEDIDRSLVNHRCSCCDSKL
ncbi:hydroxyacid oxidase 1 [Strongylocentrotus purpuratus]|uniref:(S)-2-hydroxy-acid oxidase n=1 Tax=Strongylocentrotus purpuratus TaxID=7668 RepID=A0A7M7RCJ8_STRPU|nr:hydroxyacid oxidase 1 [Strongylocentrotus purpuratus]